MIIIIMIIIIIIIIITILIKVGFSSGHSTRWPLIPGRIVIWNVGFRGGRKTGGSR